MCEFITKPKSQILFIDHFCDNLFLKSSCFFWNNSRPNDKVKRSGSVDSLIDAQQNSTKNDINLVSIGTHFSLNPTDNCAVNRRDKITSPGLSHRFKDHLSITSTPSMRLFESQHNLQDIPLSPTASFRTTKTLSGIYSLNSRHIAN